MNLEHSLNWCLSVEFVIMGTVKTTRNSHRDNGSIGASISCKSLNLSFQTLVCTHKFSNYTLEQWYPSSTNNRIWANSQSWQRILKCSTRGAHMHAQVVQRVWQQPSDLKFDSIANRAVRVAPLVSLAFNKLPHCNPLTYEGQKEFTSKDSHDSIDSTAKLRLTWISQTSSVFAEKHHCLLNIWRWKITLSCGLGHTVW